VFLQLCIVRTLQLITNIACFSAQVEVAMLKGLALALSYASLELWMHLGRSQSTQEAQ